MKCKTCKQESKVTDSRLIRGVRYRKRRCGCEEIWYSKEVRISGKYPALNPPPKNKSPSIAQPIMVNGIPVTRESPDWLKRLALKLHE